MVSVVVPVNAVIERWSRYSKSSRASDSLGEPRQSEARSGEDVLIGSNDWQCSLVANSLKRRCPRLDQEQAHAKCDEQWVPYLAQISVSDNPGPHG